MELLKELLNNTSRSVIKDDIVYQLSTYGYKVTQCKDGKRNISNPDILMPIIASTIAKQLLNPEKL